MFLWFGRPDIYRVASSCQASVSLHIVVWPGLRWISIRRHFNKAWQYLMTVNVFNMTPFQQLIIHTSSFKNVYCFGHHKLQSLFGYICNLYYSGLVLIETEWSSIDKIQNNIDCKQLLELLRLTSHFEPAIWTETRLKTTIETWTRVNDRLLQKAANEKRAVLCPCVHLNVSHKMNCIIHNLVLVPTWRSRLNII